MFANAPQHKWANTQQLRLQQRED